MLVEFTVKNFRSIKEKQVFSMVKAKKSELELSNSFSVGTSSEISLLRSAAIYGANAAGKSNVVLAMSAMQYIVRFSASARQEGDEISVTPFLFDELSSVEPTEFEMIFISEGVRYQFGFAATQEKITEEWLFAYPKGRTQKWYSRVLNSESNTYEYKFSDFLSGQKSVWQKATRSNALFLSTAVQLNSEQFKPVFNWFNYTCRLIVKGIPGKITASLFEKMETKEQVIQFLQSADLDIQDIEIKKEKFSLNHLPEDISETLKEKIMEDMKDRDVINDIKTIHKTVQGKLIALGLHDESNGTQNLFGLAGPCIDTLNNGCVLVIDELHNGLHPKMVKYLVDLFHNNETNPNNAQLIFTTHETSILNQGTFRRDQIWFCEKDDEQATSLYPLSDFSPRKNENIELGYLAGRYGALPFIKPFALAEH